MNIKILVCNFNKNILADPLPEYLPIQVGKANSGIDLNIQGDDTGDHISNKNGSYCELTGMYWAWKNLKDVDYIGLCHYRRFFDFHKFSGLPFSNKEMEVSAFPNFNLTIPDDARKILSNQGIILPKQESMKNTLYTDYCLWHVSEDLRLLEKIIEQNEDQKYIDAFDKIFYNNNEIYPCNMFIMSWKEFDKYCSWLFPILEKLENIIDIKNYNNYQKRIYGFMAERLLNIYVLANSLQIKTYPIILFSDEKKKNLSFLQHTLRRRLNRIVTNYTRLKKENIFIRDYIVVKNN